MASIGKLNGHQQKMAYLFITPTMLLFAAFTVIPVAMALYLSFTNYDVVSRMDYVGLDNYKRLAGDDLFWQTFRNVAFYSVIFVPLNIMISLLIGMLMNFKRFGVRLFRTMNYLPTLTSAGSGRYGMDLAAAPGIRACQRHLGLFRRRGTGLARADEYGDAFDHSGDAVAIGGLQYDHIHCGTSGHPRLFVRIREARRRKRLPPFHLYYMAAAPADDFPGQHDVDHRSAAVVRPSIRAYAGGAGQRDENAGLPYLPAGLQSTTDGLCFGAGVCASGRHSYFFFH